MIGRKNTAKYKFTEDRKEELVKIEIS